MSQEKIYVGNGKAIDTQYGELLKISFREEDVKILQDNLKNGWVNFDVKKRREPSDKGFTHYLELNTYVKPDSEPKKETQAGFEDDITPEDLPF